MTHCQQVVIAAQHTLALQTYLSAPAASATPHIVTAAHRTTAVAAAVQARTSTTGTAAVATHTSLTAAAEPPQTRPPKKAEGVEAQRDASIPPNLAS